MKTKNVFLRFLFLVFLPLIPHFIFPLLGEGFFLFRDVGNVYLPAKAFWVRSLRQEGAIPQWNPYNFNGAPFLADLNFGALNPLNIIFLVIPNLFWAYTVFTAIHCVLLAWGCFYCFRKFHFGERSAVLCASSFAVSGIVLSSCSLINVLGSFLALPLFGVAIRSYEKGVWPKVILAFSLAWPIYAGDPQYAYVLLGVGLLCFIYRAYKKRKIREFRDALLVLGGFIVFSAAQLLPSLGILLESQRVVDSIPLASAEFFNYRWVRLIELLAPFFFGDVGGVVPFWGHEVTQGLPRLPFYLSISGGIVLAISLVWTCVKIPKRRFFFNPCFAAFLLLFLLSMGPNAGLDLYSLFHHWVPLWNRFRFPERLCLPMLFLLFLTLRVQLRWALSPKLKLRKRRDFWKILFYAVCACIVFVGLQGSFPLEVRGAMQSLALFLVGVGLIYFSWKRGGRIAVLLVFCLILVDCLIGARRLLWSIPPSRLLEARTVVIDKILNDYSLRKNEIELGAATRFYPGSRNLGPEGIEGELRDWEQMVANRSLFYSIPSPVGYTPLEPLALLNLWGKYGKEKVSQLLDLQSIRYFLRSNDSKVGENPLQVGVNLSALPEIWFAHESKGVSSNTLALDLLFSQKEISHQWATITDPDQRDRSYALPAILSVQKRSNAVKVDYSWQEEKTDQLGLLIVQQRFHKNWKAKFEGRIIPILPANGLFLGLQLPLPANKNMASIEIHYEDPLYEVGIYITSMGLAALGIAIFLRRKLCLPISK